MQAWQCKSSEEATPHPGQLWPRQIISSLFWPARGVHALFIDNQHCSLFFLPSSRALAFNLRCGSCLCLGIHSRSREHPSHKKQRHTLALLRHRTICPTAQSCLFLWACIAKVVKNVVIENLMQLIEGFDASDRAPCPVPAFKRLSNSDGLF